jgi:hypothetical protein
VATTKKEARRLLLDYGKRTDLDGKKWSYLTEEGAFLDRFDKRLRRIAEIYGVSP